MAVSISTASVALSFAIVVEKSMRRILVGNGMFGERRQKYAV